MRILSIFLTLTLLIAGVLSCADPVAEEPFQYKLTVSSSGGGSVFAPGEGTYTYEAGKVVELVAVADECYEFVNWTGDDVINPDSATTTITMDAAKSVTANFAVLRYDLTLASTDGGSVIAPGEGTISYDCGTLVPLVAEAEEGYRFVNWTGDVDTVIYTTSAFATITMESDYSVTANFEELEPAKLFAGGSGTEEDPYRLGDWHHLNNVRYFLSAHYRLMNDLDATAPGYAELASPTANHGKGWQPIGTPFVDPVIFEIIAPVDPFAGRFNGQGCEISDLFINRPDESLVGLFSDVDGGGIVENLGVVNTEVTGNVYVGALVGYNWGTVRNSCSSASVTGSMHVGGLVGSNDGTANNSYSSGSVVGILAVGGLVGSMEHGAVSDCYSKGNVAGHAGVGGLVGDNEQGAISDSYSAGTVAGDRGVGGLVGSHGWATTSNSYYNYDEVLINGENVITIGALFCEDFGQWLAAAKSLDINERLSQENGYYVIDSVSDFKELLAFGQDGSLRFKLTSDLDLANEPNFYIPYLAGEFNGNGHKIMNLSLDFDYLAPAGLFGYLDFGGKVREVGVENANVTGDDRVGGLVGASRGTVSNSHSGGSVTGRSWVGVLVGWNNGVVSDSYSTGSVNGLNGVGGMLGKNTQIVSNSYYNYSEVLINRQNVITIGALFGEDFDQWLANDKFLDVNERLSQKEGCYLIDDIHDLKQLLAFGQDDSLKFRLRNDLDLAAEPNFYIPYLAGEFDGNGHRVWNLNLNLDFLSSVGLFGYLGCSGKVAHVGAVNVDVGGSSYVGGLVGDNWGTVSQCHSTGTLTGGGFVGGLVGHNHDTATVSNSYFTGSVTADWVVGGLSGSNRGLVNSCYSDSAVTGKMQVGGLVGDNWSAGIVSNSYSTGKTTGQHGVGGLAGTNRGTVSKSYATGRVTGEHGVGGLVGREDGGTVRSSYWDVQTSGMEDSDGGTGKTTEDMISIATFTDTATEGLDEPWHIIAVDPGETDDAYTWNIVDGQTYPFLSWQSVS